MRVGARAGRRLARQRHRLAVALRENAAALLLGAIASVPLVVACVRAGARDWWPEGHDAIIGLKAGDVFGDHPPLMGMRSTSQLIRPDLATHHPGPVQFYLLAVPQALAGSRPVGLLVGTALLGVLTVLATAVVARRRGGLPLVTAMLGGVVAVEWAVGPGTLFRLLNPYPAVLPVVLLLLLAWALLGDDLGVLWVYALTASVVAQAHLAYLPVVLALTAPLAVIGLVRWRRRRDAYWPRTGWRPAGAPRFGHGWRAVAVLVACWLPVAVESVTFSPSNASMLLRYATADVPQELLGAGRATGLVVRSLAPIPGGFSPLPEDAGRNPVYDGSGLLAVLVGLGVLALLIGTGLAGRWPRRGAAARRDRATGSAVAVYALVATGATVAGTPATAFGLVPRYFVLAVWPVAAFATALAGWLLFGAARDRLASRAADRPRPAHRPAHRAAQAAPAWLLDRTAAVRAAAVGATALVLAGAASLACASPVPMDWTDIDRARRASDAVAAELHRLGVQHRAVRIEAGGFIGFGSLSASVAYRLWSDGAPVYFSSLWPYPQDDDFRTVGAAPPEATLVLINETNPAASTEEPDNVHPESLVLTLMVNGTTMIRIYVERPAAFS